MDAIINPLLELLRPLGISEPVFQFMLVSAILGVSIYFTLYTGMFSLANAGFMAIGAYMGVVMTTEWGWPLGFAIIGGMVVAGLVAIPIGLPVLRLNDIYLAIATIGFGEVVRIFFLNFDNIVTTILTTIEGEPVRYRFLNGARGIKGIPKLSETWVLIVFLLILSFLLYRLHRSRFGRAMAAVRQDEQAAKNMGINTVYIKNIVFIWSAMIAGAAGVFNGHLTRIITPEQFDFSKTVDILSYAVLGGTSTWFGPMVGGMVMSALPEVSRSLSEYRGVFIGLVLMLMIIFVPGGLINPTGWKRTWKRLRHTDRSASLTQGEVAK
ncbi:branched-chain amino acid ABC transporter permease [Anaerolineales bacterium]